MFEEVVFGPRTVQFLDYLKTALLVTKTRDLLESKIGANKRVRCK